MQNVFIVSPKILIICGLKQTWQKMIENIGDGDWSKNKFKLHEQGKLQRQYIDVFGQPRWFSQLLTYVTFTCIPKTITAFTVQCTSFPLSSLKLLRNFLPREISWETYNVFILHTIFACGKLCAFCTSVGSGSSKPVV